MVSDMIEPGDVVVCVDDGGSNCIRNGAHYRVEDVGVSPAGYSDAGEVGLWLIGVVSPAPTGGFQAKRFRKIRPASDAFTTAMRACRPTKIGEPA